MKKSIEKIKSIFSGKLFISLNKKHKEIKPKKNRKNIWGIVSVIILSLVSIGIQLATNIFYTNLS